MMPTKKAALEAAFFLRHSDTAGGAMALTPNAIRIC